MLVTEAEFMAFVSGFVGFLKSIVFLPGMSLYVLIQYALWATAAGIVLWFAIERMGGGN